jgi:hypothetical protein
VGGWGLSLREGMDDGHRRPVQLGVQGGQGVIDGPCGRIRRDGGGDGRPVVALAGETGADRGEQGGTALSGGVGGPQRTILGVLVIAILSNGMDIIGVGQDPQSIVKGFVIIAAVALSMDRSRAGVTK